MGDRISVQFVNGKDKSVVLFAHWAGEHFANEVERYIKDLNKEVPKASCMPLERRETGTVMLDFVRWLTLQGTFRSRVMKGKDWVDVSRVMSSYYIEPDEANGDNSDNGHWIWDLASDQWHTKGG